MSRTVQRSVKKPSSKQLSAVDTLIRQGRFGEAESQSRELVSSYPHSGEALGVLGLVLVNQACYKEALPLLQKAATYTPQATAITATLGLCLFTQEQYAEAVVLLERAVAKEPHRLSARTNLGNAWLALGELAKAYECFTENVRREPLNIGANYSLSSFVTYLPDDAIFTRLPPLLEQPATLVKDKATLCYTLGKAHWDIGDTEGAFDYYHRANSYTREYKGHTQLPERGQVEKVIAAFPPERFVALQAGGLEAVPQLFVVGHSRSGKTLVETLLAGAEGVIRGGESQQLSRYVNELLSAPGELEEYLNTLTPEKCRVDAQNYLDFLEFDGTVRTATRPLDIWSLGLFGLWFPNAPIVFCQRDVMDLGLTAYFNQYTEGNDHTEDLHTLGEHIAYYEQAMQHWARVLPNPIYWVGYEELVRDPQAVAKRLLVALNLPENSDYEAEAERHAHFAKHLSPVRSLDVPMPIRQDFIGVANSFDDHLGPLREGYQAAMEAHGLPAQIIEHFDWSLQGRLVVVDNAARLPREENFTELMATNAFAVVAFDPASRVASEKVADVMEFQHVPHALLGNGQPATLYATLDESLTATLEPLPETQLPENQRNGAQILTRLPINTLRLDDIEGLASLDWLILDEHADANAVLENATRALADTLLLQVGVAFQSTHLRQPNFAEISHWASRHGFAFYRLNNPRHRSLLPLRDDIAHPQATQLATADALFIPSPERLATLGDHQRKRLAFVLDTVFGIHDLPHQLLDECDEELAERYLKARGYVGVHRAAAGGEVTPSLFGVRKPDRIAERGLAAALARHNIHRAVGLAQQLLKEQPGDTEGRYYLGLALSHLGQHDKALEQLVPLYNEVPALRYGLALGEAQYRAGLSKALRHTAERLNGQHPEHLAITRLELLLALSSRKRRELNDALERCNALLKYPQSALVAAGLGDGVSARAELLSFAARFEQALADDAPAREAALAAHVNALSALGNRQGPLRAELLTALAASYREADELTLVVEALWEACATYPYSLQTVTAYSELRTALAQSPDIKHQQLAELHSQAQQIWQSYKGEQLQFSFGDFGLPYQGFEPLMLPGTRSANERLSLYKLEEWLPEGATALDIGCNHGFLLMGLADKLDAGEGFDISKACVEVGNAVAKYLNYKHIKLHHKAFDDYVGKKQYDLVIACAVHQWIGKPLEDFGEALFSLCKPGGVVLLESQGARDLYKTESGFADNATAIASAGFSLLRKGSLCDDALNYREFWILKRTAERSIPAKSRNVEKAKGKATRKLTLPVMQGDASVLEPMRHICRLLVNHGAWFNTDLRLRAEAGNLALYGTPGGARASYMRIPMALMPQLECFDITSRQGKLISKPNSTPPLSHQQDMMEAMIELYNATDKLNLWCESLPFFTWQETPGVLDYLLGARPLNANLTRCHEQLKAGEDDKLLVDSFLSSRKFGINEHILKSMGITSAGTHRNVLLPFVDSLNHRLGAEGFYTPVLDGKPTMRTFHVPDVDTGELFVRYNLYDAVDTTLSYGFMDAASPWLASVPVTLSVSGQRLNIQGQPMQLRSPLAATIEDIRTYIPAFHRQDDRQASITKLMFCTENPYSLRRVLTYLVYQLGIAHTELVAQHLAAELEQQLIDKNLQWWKGLELLTQPLPDDHMAKRLCQHSLGIINSYKELIGLK